jgi:tetratricopeptide (TPR) repeat protein
MSMMNKVFWVLITLTFFEMSTFASVDKDEHRAIVSSRNFEKKKDFYNAVLVLRKNYNPDSYIINVMLGRLYCKQHEFVKSITHYEKALKVNPNSIEVLLELVKPVSHDQSRAQVIEVYERVLLIDSTHKKAQYKLALLHYQSGNYMDAKTQVDKLVLNYPADYLINFLAGRVYSRLYKMSKDELDYGLAYEYLMVALIEDPTCFDAKTELSNLKK